MAGRVDVDFLALTFCRSGADVQEARAALDHLGLHHVKILAKVGALICSEACTCLPSVAQHHLLLRLDFVGVPVALQWAQLEG